MILADLTGGVLSLNFHHLKNCKTQAINKLQIGQGYSKVISCTLHK